jgi:ABC-2 type transport system permease protein
MSNSTIDNNLVKNTDFELRIPNGWRSGLVNLLHTEFSKWRTKEWYRMALFWSAIINLPLIQMVANPEIALRLGTKFGSIYSLLGIFVGMFPLIAVVILLQDEIIGLKETGTAAWLLSKPVSRTALVMSKIISYSVGIIISISIIPLVLAFFVIGIFTGVYLPSLLIFGITLSAVNLFFYLSLTVMLGTIFKQRGGVVGIPMFFGLGYSMFSAIPGMNLFHPMAMFFPSANGQPMFSSLILNDFSVSFLPLVTTIFASICFICIATWKFNREEL